VVVDATKPLDKVWETVKTIVEEKLKSGGYRPAKAAR